MLCSEEDVSRIVHRITSQYGWKDNEIEELSLEVMKQMPQKGGDVRHLLCGILMAQCHRKDVYDKMAVQLLMEDHFEKTRPKFCDVMDQVQQNRDIGNIVRPLLDDAFYMFIQRERNTIDTLFQRVCSETESFPMTSFGWKTLEKTYLLRTHEGIVERPDHLWFRVALFLYRDVWEDVKACFTHLRSGKYIHATPTLFHAGLRRPQMASCFLIGIEDSVQGIFRTLANAAQISKWAGGLGIHISNIRSKDSYIHGTHGRSNGIMPMLKVFNDTSRYIDQCFGGQVRIFTERGMVPIAEVTVADRVLSQDGQFHKVLQKNMFFKNANKTISLVMKNPDRAMIVTPEHTMQVQGKEWMTIETMSWKDRFVFTTPSYSSSPGASFIMEDMTCLGLLYRHGELSGHSIILHHSSTVGEYWEKRFQSLLHRFHLLYTYAQSGNDQILTIHLSSTMGTALPCPFDKECIVSNTIPHSFLSFPKSWIDEFLQGWTAFEHDPSDNPMRLALEYIVKHEEWNRKCAVNAIQVHTQDVYVYDLVIDSNPSYQTECGMAHNGGGKRHGAFAMYIEPWHADIFDFVRARRNVGAEEDRARDLFYGLWIPDLFMQQVASDGDWYLFSPSCTPDLVSSWGKAFERAYTFHVEHGHYVKKIRAVELWMEILKSQIETGTPYMLYKDTCNRLSNQQHLGTIRSSNLCCEIIEYSDDKEYAVCNLASISLPMCLVYPPPPVFSSLIIYSKTSCAYCQLLKELIVRHNIHVAQWIYDQPLPPESRHSTYPYIIVEGRSVGGFQEFWEMYLQPTFDMTILETSVRQIVRNLNQVIDRNMYPLPECERSNLRHRPMGIGVQGLADVFFALRLPYDSEKARMLNREIFEAMYFFSLSESNQLAQQHGPYESFEGSPLSKGMFHFEAIPESFISKKFDWETLRESIASYGVRNSLCIAPMPTASTSQILGNTESFEPLTNNLYVRRTLAGEFYVCNRYLRADLEALGLWNHGPFMTQFIQSRGSIQSFSMIPSFLKQLYRTVWEIPQKSLIDMAAERQWFIDQSQSFNIYLNEPSFEKLTKIHFYGWKKGLKTGSYYVRSRAPVMAMNNITNTTQDEPMATIESSSSSSSLFCESCSA